ncbi:glycosyltransferase family 2 protein [Helicobacter turcicus]|uniref:Glycosyltransferase n=1 Tax=Helicobacter turcicus TaxID=2867412 RepID=A0ABS7JPY8_9HELI|nr:glycosyltransferase family 2 protein [Helicobacter turcicus]MBX7491427.1 glycosyltransferase [Helicobacter turcicus]MBX7545887.1 glycosyltransferase [Helicobacter turcicus]
MQAKVAVIIPVYNAEQYLKKCLDSLTSQTLTSLQILCINDGSTDRSLQILEEYVKKDKRIQILNQENSGQASARNLGIAYAHAECVYFVDSDDWLERDALERFYTLLLKSDADILLSGALAYYEHTGEYHLTEFSTILHNTPYTSSQTYCPKEIKPLIFAGFAPFFKFYRYDFLKTLLDKGELFPQKNNEEKLLFEDVLPSVKSMLLAKKICLFKQDLYYYRMREGSTMRNSYSRGAGIYDSFVIMHQVQQFLLDTHMMKEFKEEFFLFVCKYIAYHFKNCTSSFRPTFSQKSREYLATFDNSYFLTKETQKYRKKILRTLDSLNKPNGAALRVKNHLSYKLGYAIIQAKSPLKALALPLTLIQILLTHKLESKVLKTLYRFHVELQPPPLESYADYEEALETKWHLSYRLGKALLKNPLTFVFKINSIYRDYKRKKQ